MGAGAGAGGGPDGVVALGSGGGLLATGGGGGVLPAAGRGEGVPETGAPQLRQNLDAGFNSAPQRAQTGGGGGVSPSMRFPQLSQKSSPSVMGSPQYLQNFGMGVFSSLSGSFRLRGRDAVHGLSVSCRECFRRGLECTLNSVLRGIWWTGMMLVGLRGGSRKMECAQAFAPLREGGAARKKTASGSRLRSGGKGRRGEYCGGLSMHASAGAIRKGIDLPVAGVEFRVECGCRDGTPQYSPRRGPCRLSFSRHGHPIHGRAPPLSEGGVSCCSPCSLHSRESGAGFSGAHCRIPWPLFGFPDWWGEPSGRAGPAFHAARRGRLAPPRGRAWDGAESPGISAMLFWKPL